ncbi:MAG: sodium:solute symporter [Flavobacteriales bacterium]
MTWVDWCIMLGTLFFIVGYGAWKSYGSKNIQGFLKGDNRMNWWTMGLSVMATQASAITFLSTPGQAYLEGMGFLQFYFGLPLAMVIISAVFIPLYYRLKVYTAYEFLESRFDLKTRLLTASLFLLQRGMAAGITIYAPAIILSQLLDWSLNFTIIFIGVLVIIYTVSGGTKAVSQTHKQQMAVIFGGLIFAFGLLIHYLSQHISLDQGMEVAGKMGKLKVIDTEFDLSNKYNIWSGLIGGLFLQLAYFGTDQSQVQRYLGGSSIRESRIGLLFNGLLKVPMQFFILFVGILVLLFYQFHPPPLHFNEVNRQKVEHSDHSEKFDRLQKKHKELFKKKRSLIQEMKGDGAKKGAPYQDQLKQLTDQQDTLRKKAKGLIKKADPDAETKDDDYIFVTFVMNHLPVGAVGLLLAVIFSAAMSSTSAELNSLASTSTVDIYKRKLVQSGNEKHYLLASRLSTLLFGSLAILFAALASLFENLIQAVNILGSIFYGPILGIFLAAFFVKRIKGNAVFLAAIIAQIAIAVLYYLGETKPVVEIMGKKWELYLEIEYLWFNLIAPIIVIGGGILIQAFIDRSERKGEG